MRVKNKIAVSNTSPIMNLDLIDKLDLLKDFYNKILLPEAVWKELSVLESEKIENLRKEGFFEVVKAEKGPFLSLLKKKLDKGESEVICYLRGESLL